MDGVPAPTPVTFADVEPDAITVARDVLELAQVPPAVSVSEITEPTHTLKVVDGRIVPGTAFTEMICVAVQPVGAV